MHFIKPLLYLLITPFTPNWTFKQFDKSNKKTLALLITHILELIFLTIVYTPTKFGIEYIPTDYETYVVGFLIGFALRNLMSAYLIWFYANRSRSIKMKWENAFAIVVFSQPPLIIIYFIAHFLPEHKELIVIIGMIWSTILMAIGLRYYYNISILKSILLASLIFLTFILVSFTLFGIKL